MARDSADHSRPLILIKLKMTSRIGGGYARYGIIELHLSSQFSLVNQQLSLQLEINLISTNAHVQPSTRLGPQVKYLLGNH